LEGTFKDHLVQFSCNKQRLLQLDRVAQSPVQLDLKCSDGLHAYTVISDNLV